MDMSTTAMQPSQPADIDDVLRPLVAHMTGRRRTRKAIAEVEGIAIRAFGEFRARARSWPLQKRDLRALELFIEVATYWAWPPKPKPSCTRCWGTGFVSAYAHVEEGRCFQCGGYGHRR